jgi:hypothetical protein
MTKYIQIYTLFSILVFCSSAKGQYTAGLYSDTTIQGVRIENGLPKGIPPSYLTGSKFGFALLWTRVTNETTTPLELKINFPADSFPTPPSRDSYIKLFLVPDTAYYYDNNSTGINFFLDNAFNNPAPLRKTINPKKEYLFYIGIASFGKWGGMVRAGLVTKGQELFYKASIIPHFDSLLFPCGHIVFKK